MRERPKLSFIAWVPGDSRPQSISAALGGESRAFFDLGIVRRPLVPLRYLLSGLRTVAYLVRRRPHAVIMQAPPVLAAGIAWAYARLARVPIVIDSHPASFGFDGGIDRAFLPALRWLSSRVDGCIVTTGDLASRVESWGGRPLVVHEAPPGWDGLPAPAGSVQPNVLFVSTFAPDEPLMEVLKAARELSHVKFRITGDIRKLPPRARREAPQNVEWTGYLRGKEYRRALAEADVVLTLTDRDQSVPRSAYEAVYALRPLVTTDWPHMTELFPHAVLVTHDHDNISRGIGEALSRGSELAAAAPAALELQAARWRGQLDELRSALEIAEPVGGGS